MESDHQYTKLLDIDTPRLYIRKARMSDAHDIYEYAKDPLVSKYLTWNAHRSLKDSEDFLAYLIQMYEENKPSNYVIQLKGENKVIGTIGFMQVRHEDDSAEVGYCLSRKYWNLGYMSEALKALVYYSFKELKLNRLEGKHDIKNTGSGRVMQKSGMTKEGILRQYTKIKGKYIDMVYYAILYQEWLNIEDIKANSDFKIISQ